MAPTYMGVPPRRILFPCAGLLALISVLLQLPHPWVLKMGYKDSVGEYSLRFPDVKPCLPPSGVVGYLGDQKEKDMQSVMAFMLAQYNLAPVVLERGSGHEWVVGIYFTAPPTPAHLRAMRLEPVRDFGNGVVLYRRIP